MSQRQLKLVFVNSPLRTRILKIDSLRSKRPPIASSESLLRIKIARLEKLRPGAASLVEKLVDDLLAEVSP